jgi:hypothetical protein
MYSGETASCAKLKRFKQRTRKTKGFWKGWYKTETHALQHELIKQNAPCTENLALRKGKVVKK